MKVKLYKHKDYYSGMWIALTKTNGFWQQISPNYTYKGALVRWCSKNGHQIIE